VGGDTGTDVAVLKVQMDQVPATTSRLLKPLQRAGSDTLKVGQGVYAIGHPFGQMQQSLTKGIVSGVGRTLPSTVDGRPIRGMIQTDAALNPGMSGGPILNSDGDVVGMSSEILSPTGASVGIGYAVPTDTIASRVSNILQYGYFKRPTLGVLFGPEEAAKTIAGRDGAIVAAFQPNSAAEAAGFKTADIICSVGDTPIKNTNDIYASEDMHLPGEEVQVGILRPVPISRPEGSTMMMLPMNIKVVLAEAAPQSFGPPGTAPQLPKIFQAAASY